MSCYSIVSYVITYHSVVYHSVHMCIHDLTSRGRSSCARGNFLSSPSHTWYIHYIYIRNYIEREMCVYIYLYIERERCIHTCMYLSLSLYIYIYTISLSLSLWRLSPSRSRLHLPGDSAATVCRIHDCSKTNPDHLGRQLPGLLSKCYSLGVVLRLSLLWLVVVVVVVAAAVVVVVVDPLPLVWLSLLFVMEICCA